MNTTQIHQLLYKAIDKQLSSFNIHFDNPEELDEAVSMFSKYGYITAVSKKGDALLVFLKG